MGTQCCIDFVTGEIVVCLLGQLGTCWCIVVCILVSECTVILVLIIIFLLKTQRGIGVLSLISKANSVCQCLVVYSVLITAIG